MKMTKENGVKLPALKGGACGARAGQIGESPREHRAGFIAQKDRGRGS